MNKVLYKNIEVQNPFVDSFFADVLICDEKIADISQNISDENATLIDGKNKIITPGLIDRHTHGGYGCNFNTCNEDELQNYLINCQKHGITALLPTIMTDSVENINRQINLIKNINSKGAKILGIHMEGPFINPDKKGIHPEKYILSPTVENLDMLDTDFVKVLTYAPELDESGEFLKELLKRGIIPSVGHTESDFSTAQKAFLNGAKSVTHIFNAMKSIHHREPSAVVAGLNNDNIGVEIIADLEHLNSEILKLIIKSKPKNKILLITDALPISYSNKQEDTFGGEKIYYDGKRAASEEGTLAGSTLLFDDIYSKVKEFIPFKDFIGYASVNVAESLNLENYQIIAKNSENFYIWNISKAE